MSVIINDFEVVVEPPQPAVSGDSAETQSPPPQPTLTPQKIQHIRRWQHLRHQRVQAH